MKLSDFGLVKEPTSDYTRTGTEVRGTIRDPQLERLKDYDVRNEIYSIGWVLHFIFAGRESLVHEDRPVGDIVKRCTVRALGARYQTVLDLIADVEKLEPRPTDTPA
ncbi:hypothetical protein [Flexivirga oryzae]|uniref:Protein kinase domain-containing protein n=1 Tax=Flexivirga oryzae TaxID=1794944 RepID=A0A839N4B3_9MICO|nr:hypothetical protein [Flexivirga oryzae]MBB2892147.1 hypothetical protein [Flexivirga oryzae]